MAMGAKNFWADAVKAGQADDSFKMGYESQAATDRERLKAYLTGKQKEQEHALKEAGAKSRMDQLNEMLKDPRYKNRSLSLSAEGASIGSPAEHLARQDALRNQEEEAMRRETAGLQADYSKLMGKTPQQIKAITEIKAQLQNQTGLTRGMAKTALSRLAGEVGVLTDKDLERILPESYGTKLKNWWQNSVRGEIEPTMSPEQTQAILSQLDTYKTPLEKQMEAYKVELEKRAPTLAPKLSRTGKLKGAMESIGYGGADLIAGPEVTPEDQAVIDAIKADPNHPGVAAAKADIESRYGKGVFNEQQNAKR